MASEPSSHPDRGPGQGPDQGPSQDPNQGYASGVAAGTGVPPESPTPAVRGPGATTTSLHGAGPGNHQGTRMLFLGDESLADGFRLIGFETFPDPEPSLVDQIFQDLIRRGDKAFAIVDDSLIRAKIPGLERVRAEGGRIVITAVPCLREQPRLASDVADRLDAMFGKGAGAE